MGMFSQLAQGVDWSSMGAMALRIVAVLLCVLSGADMYAALGVPFSVPAVGMVLTGIFASRGANFVNDLIGKLRGQKAE